MIPTLELIRDRAPSALGNALAALDALARHEPKAARFARRAADVALGDPVANWTDAERAQLEALPETLTGA